MNPTINYIIIAHLGYSFVVVMLAFIIVLGLAIAWFQGYINGKKFLSPIARALAAKVVKKLEEVEK